MMANEPTRLEVQVYDPDQEVQIVERALPHWSQAGTITFVTWRTWDSIPADVLARFLADRDEHLRRHGIDPQAADWRRRLLALDPAVRGEFLRIFSARWNDHLDACHGACVLRRPDLSTVVANSLRHFDGERYDLTDFVIMPNHVHLLVAFPDEGALLAQCESWKHFTATQLNRRLHRTGRFWQQDGFDHLVRSPEQFERLRDYIADNPRKAHLGPGEAVHFRKPLG